MRVAPVRQLQIFGYQSCCDEGNPKWGNSYATHMGSTAQRTKELYEQNELGMSPREQTFEDTSTETEDGSGKPQDGRQDEYRLKNSK